MTPETSVTDTTVRLVLTVEAPVERAFTVFSEGFNSWWPTEFHIGSADMAEAVIEGRSGGRWYERGVDGSECDWGEVLAWDPPHHLALSWQIAPDWQRDPDAERASRIDVRFVAEGPGTTRVEFEHSQLDRHGEGWEALRDSVGGASGWPGLLEAYAKAV